MIKEIPILFSTAMVQAILDGRKTETRRVVKGGFDVSNMIHTKCLYNEKAGYQAFFRQEHDNDNWWGIKCRWQPGDVLWVRESFQPLQDGEVLMATKLPYTYKSDWAEGGGCKMSYGGKWKPSIHMPKAAARIWLEVEAVRVERLQDITEESARAEGVEKKTDDISVGLLYKYYTKANHWCNSAIASFGSLWEKINGKESLDANPWVWVVQFKVISTTGRPAHLNPAQS